MLQQNHQLLWWLLGFGPEVEVVAPADLRQQIAEKHRLAAQRYD